MNSHMIDCCRNSEHTIICYYNDIKRIITSKWLRDCTAVLALATQAQTFILNTELYLKQQRVIVTSFVRYSHEL
jgi:hypothetical protein